MVVCGLLWLFDKGVEGEAVAVEAEAGDDAFADGGQEGLVAERLTGVDVADVNLYHGGGDGRYGIGDGDRRVGVAASVEDDAAVVKTDGLQAVNDFALDVALIDVNRVLRELLNQFLQVLIKRAVAINLGLTQAHEVQVRTVDNVDGHLIS